MSWAPDLVHSGRAGRLSTGMAPNDNQNQGQQDLGVLGSQENPEIGGVETISQQDREEYEADVENVLKNDRDLDGDVDLKDAVLRKLDEAEAALRRVAERGGAIGSVASKAADLIDRIDGSGHEIQS